MVGAPFKPYFGLSGIIGPYSILLFDWDDESNLACANPPETVSGHHSRPFMRLSSESRIKVEDAIADAKNDNPLYRDTPQTKS
jgi:hypothetical protein